MMADLDLAAIDIGVLSPRARDALVSAFRGGHKAPQQVGERERDFCIERIRERYRGPELSRRLREVRAIRRRGKLLARLTEAFIRRREREERRAWLDKALQRYPSRHTLAARWASDASGLSFSYSDVKNHAQRQREDARRRAHGLPSLEDERRAHERAWMAVVMAELDGDAPLSRKKQAYVEFACGLSNREVEKRLGLAPGVAKVYRHSWVHDE